jgi:amino acid transporter
MKNNFGTTNKGNTPVAAILLCSTASLLSLLGLTDTSFNQVTHFGVLSFYVTDKTIAYLIFGRLLYGRGLLRIR